MAEFESGDCSGGECDDVFERCAEFDPGYIFVGVEAEGSAGEFVLDVRGELEVAGGDGDGGGRSGGDFLREGRSAEDGDGKMEAVRGERPQR